jgi:hypothetical protein
LSASPSPPPPWGMPGVVGCCGGTTGGGATVGGVAGQEEGATVGGVAGVGGAAAGDVGGTVTGGTASSLVASLARQTCSTGPPDRLSTSHSAHGHDGNDYASQGTRRMFHPTHALRTDCDSGASAPGRPSERQVPSNPSRSRACRLPAPSRAKEMERYEPYGEGTVAVSLPPATYPSHARGNPPLGIEPPRRARRLRSSRCLGAADIDHGLGASIGPDRTIDGVLAPWRARLRLRPPGRQCRIGDIDVHQDNSP